MNAEQISELARIQKRVEVNHWIMDRHGDLMRLDGKRVSERILELRVMELQPQAQRQRNSMLTDQEDAENREGSF